MANRSKELKGARQTVGMESKGRDMVAEANKTGSKTAFARGSVNKNVRLPRGK